MYRLLENNQAGWAQGRNGAGTRGTVSPFFVEGIHSLLLFLIRRFSFSSRRPSLLLGVPHFFYRTTPWLGRIEVELLR